MRNVLFLLVSLGLLLLLVGMSVPQVDETAVATPAAKPPLATLGLLVAASWANLLLRGRILRLAVSLAIVAVSVITLAAGVFSVYWDRHMRPGETIGWWFVGAAALSLLAQPVVWRRHLPDVFDPDRPTQP